MLSAYLKYAKSLNLATEVLWDLSGKKTIKISGKGVAKAFSQESGQHCVQRIPPTEHNGRKQTSLVCVAVLPLPPERTLQPLPQGELEIQTTKGCGPGGQNRNKVESAVRARHKPTGLEVFIDGRDQGQNKALAIRILTARVNEMRHDQADKEYGKCVGNGSEQVLVETRFAPIISWSHVRWITAQARRR